MESILIPILLSVIASLLGIIVTYMKKIVNNFEGLKEKVYEHETKITVIQNDIITLKK